jgi:hypothetical protein
MQPFCLNTVSPHRMLLSLASPAHRVVCRCSRRRTLVPPRLWMPSGTALPCSAIGSRALAQTIQSKIHALVLVGHSRYPHGISTPTACLPASQQASQPASQPLPCPPLPPTSGMPCPATACEPRSICVVPCTPHPPFVPVVMLACQMM